ncbi:MAG TPA: hypothetical protein DIC60_04270 [Lachnospiraceae bacterium]|nr:hypothetical protein [Lachnospiraceae bacterium]
MVCNLDCEHCVFEDCINDEITYEDYKKSRVIDSILGLAVPRRGRPKGGKDTSGISVKEKMRMRYLDKREEALAYSKKYAAEHREEINANRRKKRLNNKIEIDKNGE